MSPRSDLSQGRDLTELVTELLEERDDHGDGEWFRRQLSDIDKDRREQLEPFLTDVFETLDTPDNVDVTIRPGGTSRTRDFDADWSSDFEGWSGQSKPDRSDDEDGFKRRFTWRYRGQRRTWEIDVPGPLFKYYTERERTRNFGTYIADPFDEPFVASLADRIQSFGNCGLTERQQINAAVRFVQSLECTPDDVTTDQVEYPKYPVETLVHDGGDCEDTSILLGAILRELGCEVAPIVLPNYHHMILGVSPGVEIDGGFYEHDGTRYYTVEATGHGWDIGEVPRQYRNASAQVYPVGTDPILVHDWHAQPQADGTVSVTANVANFGDATAEGLEVFVEFESEESTVARQRLEGPDDVPPSITRQYESTLTLPDDRRIRGRCLLTLGYRLHDTSTSDWQSGKQ